MKQYQNVESKNFRAWIFNYTVNVKSLVPLFLISNRIFQLHNIYLLRSYFFLFVKLKPYDHVGPKGTVELTINALHKREKSKHKRNILCMSSAAIQRNIEIRPSNVHIHSIEITYVVRRHMDCTVRL
jgi:hypothetical protein